MVGNCLGFPKANVFAAHKTPDNDSRWFCSSPSVSRMSIKKHPPTPKTKRMKSTRARRFYLARTFTGRQSRPEGAVRYEARGLATRLLTAVVSTRKTKSDGHIWDSTQIWLKTVQVAWFWAGWFLIRVWVFSVTADILFSRPVVFLRTHTGRPSTRNNLHRYFFFFYEFPSPSWTQSTSLALLMYHRTNSLGSTFVKCANLALSLKRKCLFLQLLFRSFPNPRVRFLRSVV